MEKSKNEYTPKEALIALQELEQTLNVENIVKDNKIPFEYDDKKYRLRVLTPEESQELLKVRRIKKVEVLREKTSLFKSDWIKLYKDKGIDIEAKEKEIQTFHSSLKNVLIRMATISDKKILDSMKKDIIKLQNDIAEKTTEITDLLADSIEYQLQIYGDSYIAYLILEIKKEDKWERVFKSYKEFTDCTDTQFIILVYHYLSYLLYGVNNES